jgi:polysaccharide pyruvyl transferase WcaK-like protein
MSFLNRLKSLRRPSSVLTLLQGGRCATILQAERFIKRAATRLSRPRIHCFLGQGNVFQSEAILGILQKHGFRATFSPGIGGRLDDEEIFHLCNFLDVVRANFETDDARRHFYLRWRDDLLATGRRDRRAGDIALQDQMRSRLGGDGLIRRFFKLFKTNSALLLPEKPELPLLVEFFERGRDNLGFGPTPERLESGGWVSTSMYLLPEDEERALIARAFQAGKETFARPVSRQRILICGWYGTETLGDKAILGGVIGIARLRWPPILVDVASLEPYVSRMTARQMPDLRIARVLTLGEAFAAIIGVQYSAIVVGGGPLMSSIPWCTHLLELFAAAKQSGIKCLVLGCGIGPLYVDYRNAAIKHLLEIADEVVLRDRASAEMAREVLGIERECAVALDPAFVWIAQQMRMPVERDPKQILLALRNWPIDEFAACMDKEHAESVKAAYEAQLLIMIREMLRIDPSLTIIPFCMHKYAVGGDDRLFYRRLLGEFPDILARLDDRHRPPTEDLRLIARSRAVAAMRFHSVVFSLATSTPFLAVDYTLGGKIAGLLNDLGLSNLLIAIADFEGVSAARRLLSLKRAEVDILPQVAEVESTLRKCFACVAPAGESKMPVKGNANNNC